MTLDQWYQRLKRLAKKISWPVNDDPENYREAFEDGVSPSEFLIDEVSYGE